jgi:RES domain-containing protein
MDRNTCSRAGLRDSHFTPRNIRRQGSRVGNPRSIGTRRAVIAAYRLCSSRYPADSGKGAALHGGRWNPPGNEVIYGAESRALTALEVLVHYAVLPKNFVITEIRIPDGVRVSEVQGAQGAYSVLTGVEVSAYFFTGPLQIGTEWLEQRVSAVLSVPSVIIPEERNYVLNVAHPDFKHIEFLPSKPFQFDPRLKQTPAF